MNKLLLVALYMLPIISYSTVEAESFQFMESTYNFPETGSNSMVTVSLNRTELSGNTVSVSYATRNGTAIGGIDYVATSGILTWEDGDNTPKTFSVPVLHESEKTVILQLSNPTGDVTLSTPSMAILTLAKLSSTKIFVVDLAGGPGDDSGRSDHGSIIQVEPVTGNQTIISSAGFFQNGPTHIEIDNNGDLIVTVHDVPGAPPAVVRINQVTGDQTIISQGGFINTFVTGLAIEKNGDLVVCVGRSRVGVGTLARLVRINPRNGIQSSITTWSGNSGPEDVAIESSGQILVAGTGIEKIDGISYVTGAIYRVDPITGVHSILTLGEELSKAFPSGIAIDKMGNIFVTANDRFTNNHSIVKINPLTGEQSVIISFTGQPYLNGIDVDVNGDLIVTGGRSILRFDPITGTPELISPTVSSPVNEFRAPIGVITTFAIPPPIKENPTPDIRANGSDVSITITTSDNLLVTLELASGDFAGDNVDWWVLAETSFGWFYYRYETATWINIGNSISDILPTYQGRILNLPSFELLNIVGLPSGSYTFYFGIDMDMNGQLDIGMLQHDEIIVNISDTDARFVVLNDTGITTCSDEDTHGLLCPAAGFPSQDAQFGRDVTHNDDKDGHAGFSFTKLDNHGNTLPAITTKWDCVKDNVTGLVWEVKTDDGGLRDKDNTYSWYEPYNIKNGGSAGWKNGGICTGSTCDTQGFVRAVNVQGLCGANDWRMPARNELSGLAALDRVNPAIDTAYFPNTVSTIFWSSSPYASKNYDYVWLVNFNYGRHITDSKYYRYYVRLVRNGQ